ncbi:MAG: hypothetical protein RLZZ537_12 [Pseudomonadota bacterium]|jgi:predicted GIY-YIG superfamily endonuclease
MHHWYVYVLYENTADQPYFVKVGHTSDPVRRLRMLQSGNPRLLRAPDYERMPNGPFGIGFSTRADAIAVESAVHQRLRQLGYGLKGDFNYDKEVSYTREWYSHIHPEDVWLMVIEEARPFLELCVHLQPKP